MEAIVITLLIAFPLAGAVVRRWSAVLLPVAGWTVFYLGLGGGWWGDGLGDGWQYAAAALLLVGVGTTAVHVALARRVRPRVRDGHASLGS
jgi:hypothetical protein